MNTHTLRDIKAMPRPPQRGEVEAPQSIVAEDRDSSANENDTAMAAEVPSSAFWEKAPVFLILLLTFLLPLFVIPSSGVNFNISKMLFATLSLGSAFGLWLLGRLKTGVLTLPRTALTALVFAVPFTFAIAAFFSDVPSASFMGQGFEPGTVYFLLLCAVAFFLGTVLFGTWARVMAFHLALLASFAIILLFQGLRFLFGYDLLSFGVLTSSVANLVGKWNDLGIFAGLMALIAVSTIELSDIRGPIRALWYSALGLGLGLLIVVNFRIVWITLGVCTALLAAFMMRRSQVLHRDRDAVREDRPARVAARGKMPVVSFIVLGITILFAIVGQPVGEWAARNLDISHLEARPSFVSTVGVARQALTDPRAIVFGVGPNRFLQPWLLYKPAELNLTPFWSIDFNFGVGWVPTFLITAGLLGIIGLALFLLPLLRTGLKGVSIALADSLLSSPIIGSVLAALFLWILVFVYIPNGVMVMLAFLISGVAVSAILRGANSLPRNIVFGISKLGFLVSLVLVVLIGGVLWSDYLVITRFAAASHFATAARALESGDPQAALAAGEEAAGWANLDVHYRLLAQAGIARMRQVVAETSGGEVEESLRAEFRQTLEGAVEHARMATDLDPYNYENWATRGLVYGILVPFGVEGAYENSASGYRRAIELNPQNPALYLALARVTMEHSDYDEARTLVGQALESKANYSEAAFFLSQLEVRAGNLDAAKESAEAAVTINPDDPLALFQLGLLRYNDEEYGGAIAALERAVSVNKEYSNARYFLGLSYAHENQTDEAVAQFVEIEKYNKDNAEVKSILENLRAGRAPLAGEEATPEPEDRDKLPIEEDE
jgi:tetratricopeptide (TPR) repeat protein